MGDDANLYIAGEWRPTINGARLENRYPADCRLRRGTIWINDYHPYVPQAEWGGMKRSGVGRELGRIGLDEYREIKPHCGESPGQSTSGRTPTRGPSAGSGTDSTAPSQMIVRTRS
jgi:hypothetical protein